VPEHLDIEIYVGNGGKTALVLEIGTRKKRYLKKNKLK
jgi:hypothetical protein